MSNINVLNNVSDPDLAKLKELEDYKYYLKEKGDYVFEKSKDILYSEGIIEFYKFIQTHRNNIKFCILKECAIEQLNHKEELFINKYHPKFNYAGNVSHFVPIKH